MKVFSDLLLEIYRLTQEEAPSDEFQNLALDRTREVFDFDSAFWSTGVVLPGKTIVPHAFHLYRQPLEMMENWMRINKNDELAFEAFSQQGVTVNAALCGPHWQSRFGPEEREHIKHYGMAHCLCTIFAEPVLQIWNGVSFYRANPERPFAEDERLLKQYLMPHLAEAWNISRFALVNSARNNRTKANYGKAICDRKGVLYNADRNFSGFMLAEWPEWNGPKLPPELLETLSGICPRRYAGRHTVITVETLNNMEVLNARKTAAIDMLSSREHEIAALFAQGADFRAIADVLHIAPATVRNHLQHIYSKLGARNKMDMARLMRGD